MSRGTNAFLAFLVLFGIIFGGYVWAEKKVVTRSTDWATNKINIFKDKYNVIVVGSDPEGVAAAIAAARSGAKTLLLGKEDGPGGLLTYGMLNTLDMNYNSAGELLTRGIFNEFYIEIGKVDSFDVEKAKSVFSNMIKNEKMLEYRPNCEFDAPILDGNTIMGVQVKNKDGEIEKFFADRVIDATQDGDVCVSSGVPYYNGMEDAHWPYKMAATLVFKVEGVKWEDIEEDIDIYKRKTKDTSCGFNSSSVWGFGKWCYDKYTPLHENMQLRGPNMGRQDDGTILINALQIFNVDSANPESIKLAKEQATEEAANAVEHLRKILKSFKDAKLAGVADQLYIRETRHIQGEYVLKVTDLIGNRNFANKIALGSYPLDIQATSKGSRGYIIGAPNQYSIPLECTIPQKIDNLFIVGKAASYSSVAAGSTRVVPVGMVVGESAGVAAVYTIYKDITPRELLKSNSRLRQYTRILKNQNVYLPEFNFGDPNGNVKGYNKIKRLIDLGFIVSGYSNDFMFEKDATMEMLCKTICNGLQFGGNEKYSLNVAVKISNLLSTEPLTAVKAARACTILLNDYEMPEEVSKYDNRGAEKSAETIAEENAFRDAKIDNDVWFLADTHKYFSEGLPAKDKVLTRREMYILVVDTLERYIGRELKA